MTTEYKINIVNEQSKSRKFWLFLSEPEKAAGKEVFANSSAYMTLDKTGPGDLSNFTIPLQYKLKASASNHAVGLDTKIMTRAMTDTDLGMSWDAEFFPGEEHRNPHLIEAGDQADVKEVMVKTNAFDPDDQMRFSWYNCMTFGVESESGFIGYSWVPDPSDEYDIVPKVSFYVSTGSFESNVLADMNQISKEAANVTEKDFDIRNECTVTLRVDGTWDIEPGAPSLMLSSNVLNNLVESHLNLTSSHATLVELMTRKSAKDSTENQLMATPWLKWFVKGIANRTAQTSAYTLQQMMRIHIVNFLRPTGVELESIQVKEDGKIEAEFKRPNNHGLVQGADKYEQISLDATNSALKEAKKKKMVTDYKVSLSKNFVQDILELSK
ncbi:hypothetical protein [Vibrio sp. NH-UV-68]|uniref:hypothetical protein n=1 Tax=unclassified Vibrio TaxID=2614977 RepID=UPI0036F380C0